MTKGRNFINNGKGQVLLSSTDGNMMGISLVKDSKDSIESFQLLLKMFIFSGSSIEIPLWYSYKEVIKVMGDNDKGPIF